MAENTHSGEREIGIEDRQLECGTVVPPHGMQDSSSPTRD